MVACAPPEIESAATTLGRGLEVSRTTTTAIPSSVAVTPMGHEKAVPGVSTLVPLAAGLGLRGAVNVGSYPPSTSTPLRMPMSDSWYATGPGAATMTGDWVV